MRGCLSYSFNRRTEDLLKKHRQDCQLPTLLSPSNTENFDGKQWIKNDIISDKTSINKGKICVKRESLQTTVNQLVIKLCKKRCLFGFQKGVI